MATPIPVLNSNKDDLSYEFYVQVGMIMEMLQACQIICEKCSRTLDNFKYKETFFQKKKQTIAALHRQFKHVCDNIDRNFDGILQSVYDKYPNDAGGAYDSLQRAALEDIRILLIFMHRCDGDAEKQHKMEKAMLNFKPGDGENFNLDGLMKYYNFDKKWK